MILTAFDTETSGLLNFKRPLSDSSQPHLVQMALIMVDTITRDVLKKASFIVQCNVPISKEAFLAHGINQETSLSLGIQCKTAIAMFKHFGTRSDRMVAHNKDFDIKIFKAQALREGVDLEFLEKKDIFCTMAASRDIVKCPPTPKMIAAGFGNSFKAPQLGECYQHFYGEKLEGAHDALVDTEACLRVYFTLKDMGVAVEA